MGATGREDRGSGEGESRKGMWAGGGGDEDDVGVVITGGDGVLVKAGQEEGFVNKGIVRD